ncbi:MAG: long-chain fatty acid--CoA ligase [Bacteroidetes bacterium]|nr:long-chain fatty acid--CoA ligase [Bacteroidota bacterium]
MEVIRIFDLLPYYEQKYKPKDDVIASKENGQWVKYSIKQYREMADNIGYGFLALGVQPGDKIAQISSNRVEWNIVDMAILQVGAIHVPIYPTVSESDYKYILNHAEVKYVFVSGMELLRKIQHILPEVPSLKGIYTYKDHHELKHLSELVDQGKTNPAPELLEKRKEAIGPDDIATIIYTSGTTGNPKGVMLSHNNIISNFKACAHIPPFGEEARAISYLPLCHVYERMLNYLYQYDGISVYYAETIGTITDNMKDIRPQILSTVPRLLEKIYDKLVSTGHKLKGPKSWIFWWAFHLALRYELNGANGWFYELKRKLYDRLVYCKWRDVMGGEIEIIVSGGAALQPRLGRMFTCAGIHILEGYGLTETSPVIAVSDFCENGIKFGTVGPVIKKTEVKIADDGEICVKGPGVMLGYYKEPEMTKDAVDAEGWFHTGDLGHIEPEGQLKITGRKKELFKTSFGKYVSPQPIEDKFKESLFIDQILVVGENQKFAGALIVPDFAFLKDYCKEKEIEFTNPAEVIANQKIRKRFAAEIKKYNKLFGETEQIKSWDLLDHEWTLESGEITPTLKLKRKFLQSKYTEHIDRLFK